MNDREYPEPDTEPPSLDPEALYDRLRSGDPVSLIDLRDRDEFEAWRVAGASVDAVQVPFARFVAAEVTGDVRDRFEETGLSPPVVAVCARDDASAYVAGLLVEEGIDAVNLTDGMNGWARVYVSSDLSHDGPATVRQYYRPSSGCLSYLVREGDEAVVVDPLRAFADRYVEDANDLGSTIIRAVDTHVHADHLSGVRAVAERTGGEPTLPAGAVDRGLSFDAATIEDGDRLPVGDAVVEAVHAPGHTSEMTALRVDDRTLLSGDGLFLAGVARPDLERGDQGARDLAERLYETLRSLIDLPGETLVAPGHVDPEAVPTADGTFAASLAEIRRDVALLALDRDTFVERVLEDLPPRPANHERIIAANLGRDSVDDDEGFELELGPNNCAVPGD